MEFNIKEIEALARLFKDASLTELVITDGAAKIKMKRAPAQTGNCAPVVEHTEAAVEPAQQEESPRRKTIKSPMAGVFYAAPSPDAQPFVQVGDTVNEGDVLCVIEAMKLMNELTADISGTVAEICVTNEQIVEYGQILFKIE